MDTHAATPSASKPAAERTCATCARLRLPPNDRMVALGGWGRCAHSPVGYYVSLNRRFACRHGNAWRPARA